MSREERRIHLVTKHRAVTLLEFRAHVSEPVYDVVSELDHEGEMLRIYHTQAAIDIEAPGDWRWLVSFKTGYPSDEFRGESFYIKEKGITVYVIDLLLRLKEWERIQ